MKNRPVTGIFDLGFGEVDGSCMEMHFVTKLFGVMPLNRIMKKKMTMAVKDNANAANAADAHDSDDDDDDDDDDDGEEDTDNDKQHDAGGL